MCLQGKVRSFAFFFVQLFYLCQIFCLTFNWIFFSTAMNSIDQFQATLLADPAHPDKRMRCVQEFYYVKEHAKIDALINFFHKAKAESSQNKYPRAAVFCSNFHCLMLTLALNYAEIEALPACKSAIAQFNNDEASVLFLTDECEDLADIDYNKFDVIINFDFPQDMESYFKRLSKVCAERNAKYATYADPSIDAVLLCKVTRTLGVGLNDVINSTFSNQQTPLHLANRDKTPYTHSNQQQERVIRSFEADVTVNDNDVAAAGGGNESDSGDDTTDDDSEGSLAIKKAANVVGNEIEGVLGDILGAFFGLAKFSFAVAAFSVIAYFISSPFITR